ncbi:MAG: hypothetical protein IPK19_39660 [Chloroflexi bacterium]|nr:hypothetical protein [Chloroflexota bacterium]
MAHQVRARRIGLIPRSVRGWLVGVVALLIGVVPAQAAVFNPGCAAGIGDTAALAAAVTSAGSNGQADTITLVAGCTYTLTATLVVNADGGNPLTLNGSGATLSGSSARAIFNIFGASSVTLNNTILANGFGGSGGSIYNEGTLTIHDSVITGNSATVFGGGIYNAGTLVVNDSTFTNNAASGTALGGAIYNAANKSLAINRSTFTDNTAFQGAAIHNAAGTLTVDTSAFVHNIAAELGGGIRSAGSSGNTTVRSSLFTNNQASNGGAYYNSVGYVTIENSTFSGNQANNGGGLYILSGIISLTSSTIAANSATSNGGGIYVNAQTVSMANVLVAANSAPTNPDASGAIVSNGYNLIGNSSGTTGLVASDLTGAAATPLNLGALADNGGPTRTMALLPGSVAIDQGNPSSQNIGFDQRMVGYARVTNNRIDIGAFEAQPACPSFPASIANGDSAALIAAVNCANRTPGSEVINLAANGGYALTSLNYSTVYALQFGGSFNGLPYVNDTSVSGALTINGNGATLVRNAAVPVFRIIEVASGGNLTLNNLTLSNGSNNYGAGIYNSGTLAVNTTLISGNSGIHGGGIYNLGALTASGSSFINNVTYSPTISFSYGALSSTGRAARRRSACQHFPTMTRRLMAEPFTMVGQ